MNTDGKDSGKKVFRYKLDFYYQQAILYLVTLILYGGIRGTYAFERLPSMETDPILYIIVWFVIISFGVLLVNKLRDRKLIVTSDSLIFHHRWHERHIPFADIEWLYIGRERTVQTAGRFQVIVFKIAGRRRLFRIRVGRYERDMELLAEMGRISEHVPRGRRPWFGLRMSKSS